MSWSQLVHPAQLSGAHYPHNRLNGGSTPAPGATTTIGQTYSLDSSMGLSSNGGGYHSSDGTQVRLPSLHLSQFHTSLSPANFLPIRDPEHYEKLDQIGKGNLTQQGPFINYVMHLGWRRGLPFALCKGIKLRT